MRVQMYRKLVKNTLFNGAAFGLTALLGLITAPLIINQWGIEAFGLIILARAFLPGGLISLFDPALSETTAMVIARARQNELWKAADQGLPALTLIATGTGLTLAILVTLAATPLIQFLNVPERLQDDFAPLVQLSALVLLLAFPALVADGVMRGYERFDLVRLNEVAFQLLFVLSVVALALSNGAFLWIAYGYILIITLRSGVAILLALRLLRRHERRLAAPGPWARAYVIRQSFLLTQNKFFGGILPLLIPPLISAMLGPASLAIYDVLMRIPRFVKVLAGLIPSALLPVAARLQQKSNKAELGLAGRVGLLILPAVTLPFIGAFAGSSESLLRLWIGASMAPYWPWLSLAFVPLAFGQINNVPGVLMAADPAALKRNNLVTLCYTACWFVLGFALVPVFKEFAFIASASFAALLSFPWRLKIIQNALMIELGEAMPRLLVLLVTMLFTVIVSRLSSLALNANTLLSVIVSIPLAGSISTLLLYIFYLTSGERQLVQKVILIGHSNREC